MSLSDNQKALRLHKIPCSLIGAILGVDKWKTPYQAWREIMGMEETREDSTFAEWGHRLEAVVAQKFFDKNGVIGTKNDETLVYENWLCGTPDYYYTMDENKRGLEIKTTSAWNASEFGDEHTDELPLRHFLQCTGYIILTGLDSWDLAVLIGGNTYREYKILPSIDQKQKLLTRLKTWYETYVVGNTEPPLTGADVLIKWPSESEGAVLNADAHVIELLGKMKAEKAVIDEHTEIYDTYKKEVQLLMGEAGTLMDGDSKLVNFSTQQRVSLDAARMKKEAPELYQKFLKTTSSRVFRVLDKKEKE